MRGLFSRRMIEKMSKKFSTKKLKLRGKASRRRQSLKVNPPELKRKPTLQEQNREAISKVEAKIKK